MSASRELFIRSVLTVALAVAGGSCDDPNRILETPPLDRSMRLFGVFDPDSSWHPVFIESLDVGGGFQRLDARLYRNGVLVAVGAEVDMTDPMHYTDSLASCSIRYGTLGINSAVACPVFQVAIEPGATYRLVVTADDRPTADVTFTVPGPFNFAHLNTDGSPPGTDGIDAGWTVSPGAYGYFVSLRATSTDCDDAHGCDGWFVATRDTSISATVPAAALDPGRGPWYVDISALSQGLYQYLTTGEAGDLFSVPPIENVEGGHGAVGAWYRRSTDAR